MLAAAAAPPRPLSGAKRDQMRAGSRIFSAVPAAQCRPRSVGLLPRVTPASQSVEIVDVEDEVDADAKTGIGLQSAAPRRVAFCADAGKPVEVHSIDESPSPSREGSSAIRTRTNASNSNRWSQIDSLAWHAAAARMAAWATPSNSSSSRNTAPSNALDALRSQPPPCARAPPSATEIKQSPLASAPTVASKKASTKAPQRARGIRAARPRAVATPSNEDALLPPQKRRLRSTPSATADAVDSGRGGARHPPHTVAAACGTRFGSKSSSEKMLFRCGLDSSRAEGDTEAHDVCFRVWPKGAIDMYGMPEDPLHRYRPNFNWADPSNDAMAAHSPNLPLDLFAVTMDDAEEEIRRSAESVLHSAWGVDKKVCQYISRLLDLEVAGSNGMTLRSGRRMSPVQGAGTKELRKWLIWEEIAPPVSIAQGQSGGKRNAVGALVLRQMPPPSAPARKRKDINAAGVMPGSAFIEYVAASRRRGGRGWPMVLAAESICKMEGLSALYSAADLLMDGRYADAELDMSTGADTGSAPTRPKGDSTISGALASGNDERGHGVARGTSAKAAHERWGFQPISVDEWKAAGLVPYDSQKCSVIYMRKILPC